MVDVGRQNAILEQDAGMRVVGEIQCPRQHIDQHHRREDQPFRGGRQVSEVFLSAFVTFFILVMRDQGIGADADDLVKQIKGQQIVREGAAHRAEQRQGKASVESRLIVLVQAAHVTGRIEHCHHPQERSGNCKDHRQCVRPKRNA